MFQFHYSLTNLRFFITEMSELFLTAQAFVFFIAGFETSSTAMSHAMYELALNQDIQDKLRKEVNASFAENNGKLSYDNVRSMDYLDKVFKGEFFIDMY